MIHLDPTERMNLTLSAGVVAASFALAPPHFAGSLAFGAALEAVNCRALHQHARALFEGQVSGGRAWVGLLGLRFVLLVVGVAAAIQLGAHPVALLIGLSLVVPAAVIAAILNRPPVLPAESLPALPPDDPSWDRYSIFRAREVEPPADDGDDGPLGTPGQACEDPR